MSAEVRVYDHLFKTEHPDDAPEGKTFLDNINPDSLEIVRDAKLEPSLANAKPGEHFQFERLGYFFTDPVDSKPGKPVFNRTSTLRDTWAKEASEGMNDDWLQLEFGELNRAHCRRLLRVSRSPRSRRSGRIAPREASLLIRSTVDSAIFTAFGCDSSSVPSENTWP